VRAKSLAVPKGRMPSRSWAANAPSRTVLTLPFRLRPLRSRRVRFGSPCNARICPNSGAPARVPLVFSIKPAPRTRIEPILVLA
jgi:hypothetical protein